MVSKKILLEELDKLIFYRKCIMDLENQFTKKTGINIVNSSIDVHMVNADKDDRKVIRQLKGKENAFNGETYCGVVSANYKGVKIFALVSKLKGAK